MLAKLVHNERSELDLNNQSLFLILCAATARHVQAAHIYIYRTRLLWVHIRTYSSSVPHICTGISSSCARLEFQPSLLQARAGAAITSMAKVTSYSGLKYPFGLNVYSTTCINELLLIRTYAHTYVCTQYI